MRPTFSSALISLAAYSAFTGFCAWLHGTQPGLNIDHLAYLRRAETLLTQFPAGDYWRGYDVRNTYAILLAWLHGWTGDHIISLKWLLGGMSLAWLATLEWWFRALPLTPTQARLAALVGGLHFSFGAPLWGVSSFDGSLHRTLVMPLLFLLLGWHWRQRDRSIRLLSLPLAGLLCLVHLGSAYLLAVLAVTEIWQWLRPGRQRPGRTEAWYLAAALASATAVIVAIQLSGLALTAEAATRLLPTAASAAKDLISPQEAWAIEWATLRWRNFPPDAATLVVLFASAGPLILLGLGGAWVRQRTPESQEADSFLLRFGFAAVLVAFSWQATLAALRPWFPLYPANFEELRAIVWVVPPLVYFWLRGLGNLTDTVHQRRVRTALYLGAVFLVIQPIRLAHFLPAAWKERLIAVAISGSATDPNVVIRLRTARQWLGLDVNEPRLYYDALGVVAWLKAHTKPAQRVLSDRDECRFADVEVIGAPTGFFGRPLRTTAAVAWLQLNREVQRALRARDIATLRGLARVHHADYIVIEGALPGSVYSDAFFSVIAVNAPLH